MKYFNLGNSDLKVSQIAIGCMRIADMQIADIAKMIDKTYENGINFYDHADIYGGGNCQKVFAKGLKESGLKREEIVIQSKCGIRRDKKLGKSYFDFSKEYILDSVDGILSSLDTDYLDVLLLHRPDALMDPSEVAEAFDLLKTSGKVRNFGVSNQNPYQIKLLQKYCNTPIVANQLQFSLTNSTMVKAGINVNMENNEAINRDGSVLDFCRFNNITIQPWSPFQYGFFEGTFLGSDKFPELNSAIDELAEKYNVTNSAIAIAWICRHPANMQPIIGSTNLERILSIAKATDVNLSRAEWYDLYKAAGNKLP